MEEILERKGFCLEMQKILKQVKKQNTAEDKHMIIKRLKKRYP